MSKNLFTRRRNSITTLSSRFSHSQQDSCFPLFPSTTSLPPSTLSASNTKPEIQNAIKFIWPSNTRPHHTYKPYFSPSRWVELKDQDLNKTSYDEIVIVWKSDGSVALFVRRDENWKDVVE